VRKHLYFFCFGSKQFQPISSAEKKYEKSKPKGIENKKKLLHILSKKQFEVESMDLMLFMP
jgi:hypothetical protein